MATQSEEEARKQKAEADWLRKQQMGIANIFAPRDENEAPDPMSPLDSALSFLQDSVEETLRRLAQVEQRLLPLMRLEEEQGGTVPAPNAPIGRSPYVTRVQETAGSVHAVTKRLERLLKLLDV